MYCVKCGKEITDNTKYCTGCGAAASNRQKPKVNTKAVVFVLLAAVVFCAGSGTMWFLQQVQGGGTNPYLVNNPNKEPESAYVVRLNNDSYPEHVNCKVT